MAVGTEKAVLSHESALALLDLSDNIPDSVHLLVVDDHATLPTHDGSDPRFVEKDYYVTETLRVVAATLPDRTIFKGGTSLSKGWPAGLTSVSLRIGVAVAEVSLPPGRERLVCT